eukprot:TRINITY_DN26271_c0_g1_i1.p2 TRINITY_DN26271_c0_g1~~TRINITY_DN26271_c0_g1_i1.p2  ORF type:complete len:217 (+),score=92.56 TRINITY_DN26271_c0_g1_i1:56-652(+)
MPDALAVLRQAHAARLEKGLRQRCPDAKDPAATAAAVVDAMLEAHPPQGGKLTDRFRLQFRSVSLNVGNIAKALCSGALPPSRVATASSKELASEDMRRATDEMRQDLLDSVVFTEAVQSRCDLCGRQILALANANVLGDFEGGESWKRGEMDDDWCYCEAEDRERAKAASGEAAKRAADTGDDPPAKRGRAAEGDAS